MSACILLIPRYSARFFLRFGHRQRDKQKMSANANEMRLRAYNECFPSNIRIHFYNDHEKKLYLTDLIRNLNFGGLPKTKNAFVLNLAKISSSYLKYLYDDGLPKFSISSLHLIRQRMKRTRSLETHILF